MANKVAEWRDAIVRRTGFDKFMTMNVVSVIAGLGVWITLYNVIPNNPIIPEPPQAEVKTKSTKTKKENN